MHEKRRFRPFLGQKSAILAKFGAFLLLFGCSASAQGAQNSLQPLPTTGIRQPTNRSLDQSEQASSEYQINLRNTFVGFMPYTQDVLLSLGYIWCESLINGRHLTNLLDDARNVIQDQNEYELTQAIIVTASLDLCPEK